MVTRFEPPTACRICDRPTRGEHAEGCFWATHRQGAVPGMRYAWTTQEAPLGDLIERLREDLMWAECHRLDLEHDNQRLRREVRGLRLALILAQPFIVFAGYQFAEVVA